MTKQEFETRVQMPVSQEEYKAIEVVYMNSDLDKDDFCNQWVKMNKKRVSDYKENRKLVESIRAIDDKYWLKSIDWLYKTKAVDAFSVKEIQTIERAGITVYEKTHGCVIRQKSAQDVIREIVKYLSVA